MRLGSRGHDVMAEGPEDLCAKLNALGINEIQLVAHKSFPDFQYNEENVRKLAEVLAKNNIKVAVFGCYVDPLTAAGEARFLEHIRYAKLLNAGVIATETAVCVTQLQEDEDTYQKLVDVFRKFTAEGQRRGVNIAVETVSAHPICDPKRTKRLLDDVNADNFFTILDPHNLHDGDVAIMREKTLEAISLYGDRVVAVHWKDPAAVLDDPAFRFVEKNSKAVLITEGLTGDTLGSVISDFKKETEKNS